MFLVCPSIIPMKGTTNSDGFPVCSARHRGNWRHPSMVNGNKAITLNSVVQSDNFRELVKMAEVARDWGFDINFSPYTWPAHR